MENKKRNTRSYKVIDSIYFKAQKQAAKDGTTVANIIEDYITHYAKQSEISKKVDKFINTNRV